MTDEKKPPAFDPDKTMVERRSEPPSRADTSEKPAAGQATRPVAAPPPATDSDRTMISVAPVPPSARKAAPDMDRTMVGGIAPSAPTALSGGPANFELVGLSGTARGRKFGLRGTQNLVGSNATCQVVIPGIESVHAKFQETADGAEMQNLGTEGSIIVGGRRSARATLKSGDLLKIGDVVLRFVRTGDVFSSDYSEEELVASGLGKFLHPDVLKQNWRYLAIGGLVVLFVAVIWPVAQQTRTVKATNEPSATEIAKARQVDSLLQLGETLFNAGKYVARPDQADGDNAYSKFNEVLSLDPGNARARQWLTQIDKKLEEEKSNREQQEKAKLAAAQEARERQRKALEGRVKELIEQGDQLYAAGQIAEPAGRNALVFYREALKVDDQSILAKAAISKAIQYYIDNGDRLREAGDSWKALDQYRKGSRASGGQDQEIEARVRETEVQLRSGMAATDAFLVMYRDDRGQVVVLDDLEKVPARYRDRAVEIRPQKPAAR